MKHMALICLFFLAGCAHDPAEPQIIYRDVEVKVPVREPCKAPTPPRPDYPLDKMPLGQDIFTQSKTSMADRQLRVARERALEEALAECQK